MIETDNSFKDILKIHQIYTKHSPNHLPWTKSANFEEFKKVYNGVLGGKIAGTKSQMSLRKITRIPPHKLRNTTDKTKIDLKIVHLEMPPLGTEQAIVLPLKKKSTVPTTNNGLKKSSTEKNHLALTLVQKLQELDIKKPRRKVDLNEIKKHPSDCLVDANQEINIAEKQLEHIRELIKKRAEENRKTVRPIGFRRKSSARHTNCATKTYLSTLMAMQKKLKQLEDKYFNRPQIVYKSVQDTFTQSSDVKIIYENSKYPENANLDQTLKNIMNELDDIANVNVDQPCTTVCKRMKEKGPMLNSQKKPSEKNKVADYFDEQLSSIEREEHNSNDGDIEYETQRSYVPRNLSFMKSYHKYFGNKNSSSVSSLLKVKNDSRKPAKWKPKVNFKEETKMVPTAKVSSLGDLETISSTSSLPKIKANMKVNKNNKILREEEEIDIYYNYCNILNKNKYDFRDLNENKEAAAKIKKINVSDLLERYRRTEESDEPDIKIKPDDSIFALLDDTRANLEELMNVRKDVYKNLESNHITAMPNFKQNKAVGDVCMNSANINKSDESKYKSNIHSFKISDNFVKGYEYTDPIAETIDKSEAHLKKITSIHKSDNIPERVETNLTLKKLRDIKHDVSKVATICNEITNLINEEPEKKEADNQVNPPKNEGGGDECGIFDGTGLQKSVVKSCFLMKEFDIKPNIKFFREKDGCNASKKSFEAHTEVLKASSLLSMDKLKKRLASVLENSIYSFTSEES